MKLDSSGMDKVEKVEDADEGIGVDELGADRGGKGDEVGAGGEIGVDEDRGDRADDVEEEEAAFP